MRECRGATADGKADGGAHEHRGASDRRHGGHNARSHGHGHDGATDRSADERGDEEADDHERKRAALEHGADDLTQAAVLQHPADDASAGDDQQDHADGLERAVEQGLELGAGVATAGAQQIHGDERGDGEGDKRLAQEGEDRGDLLGHGDIRGQRAQQDQAQWGEHDGEDHAKGGKLLVVARALGGGEVLGDVRKDAATHVAAPDDTGDGHGDKGGGDTDEDHGAQIDAERAGDQNRAGRRWHERIAGCQSREQGDAVVEG